MFPASRRLRPIRRVAARAAEGEWPWISSSERRRRSTLRKKRLASRFCNWTRARRLPGRLAHAVHREPRALPEHSPRRNYARNLRSFTQDRAVPGVDGIGAERARHARRPHTLSRLRRRQGHRAEDGGEDRDPLRRADAGGHRAGAGAADRGQRHQRAEARPYRAGGDNVGGACRAISASSAVVSIRFSARRSTIRRATRRLCRSSPNSKNTSARPASPRP